MLYWNFIRSLLVCVRPIELCYVFCNGRVRVTTKVRSMLFLLPDNVNLLRKWFRTITHFNNLQAEFRKFLFGYLEVFVVVAPANWILKIEIALWRSGMDLSTVNLQAEFRKFVFGYLEVLIAPANWISKIEIALCIRRSGKGPLNS